MKKQCTKVFSALAVLAMLGGSLVSCGEKKASHFGGVEAKYFYSYFTQPIDGKDDLATTSGMTLLESGTEGVKAHAYKAPENFKISWEVLDEQGKETNDVKIAEDGSVTLPSVTGSGAAARKDYTVYCIASDPKDSEKVVRYKSMLTVVPKGSIKTGKQDLQSLKTEDTQPLMGQVETLGLETGMTGMNFWAYGGYQKIAPRVFNSRSENGKFTSSTYVPGFGFGHTIYSYLTADNPKETNSSWKRYFHTDNSTIPTNVNYYLASGTGVTDYYGYATSGYFTKLLNESDLDVYTPGLAAVAEPIPCDDENGKELTGDAAKGFHKTWKVYMNTGSTKNKVTYRNLGTKNGSAFEKKGVELEDYVTPFIMQYTQWVGCANVSQLLSGSSALEGAAEYYESTKVDPGEGKRKVSVAEFLEKFPGIKLNKEDNSITFVLATGCTSDFAAYRLGGNSPIPMEFVTDVLGKGDLKAGMTKYGTKDESDGSNPEDNFLSTGPLVLEKLDENRVVYKRNEDWWVKKDPAGRDIYKMEGFVYNYNSALKQDSSGETLYNSYVAGYTETSGLPSAKLNDLKNDPDTVHIENTGEKNGVSFNALNRVDYDYLFGTGDFDAHAIAGQFYGDFELGSAGNKEFRKTFFENDWEVKPIMSNHNFVKGLNTGYDRDTFAETKGRKGFSDYFGDVNKMSPKAAQRYNDTDDHINAVKSVYGEQGIPTDSSAVALGVQYFKAALQEELEAGHYVLGTEDAPAEIHVNVNWQSQVWPDYQGTAIFNSISETFNSAVSSNAQWIGDNKKPLVKLVFDQTYEGSGANDYQNAYAKVALGQYDIAQASISGGEYDVFTEPGLWESYNRDYSLTIHHAYVTNIPSSYIYFDGGYWSTDALYYANTQGVTLNDAGRIVYEDLNPIA